MPSKPYKPVLLERLKNQEYSINYLTEVLQNETELIKSTILGFLINEREASVADFAKQIGVTRQGLYKMLSEDGNPRLSTLSELLKSLGMKMQICGEVAA